MKEAKKLKPKKKHQPKKVKPLPVSASPSPSPSASPEPEPSTSSSHPHTLFPPAPSHLDESLFTAASTFFNPPLPLSGISKRASKLAVKLVRREERERREEVDARVGEGGSRSVGFVVFLFFFFGGREGGHVTDRFEIVSEI